MRFEIKSSYPREMDPAVVAWVRAHRLAFRVPYPDRRINNVYLDTYDLRAFAENVAGISSRSKARFRWYGPEDLPRPGTLEFKNKLAALGWKDNFKITSNPHAPGGTWRDFQRTLRRSLPAADRIRFDACGQPTLINRYTRRYFVSRDGRVRITLDAEQVMYDQLRSPFPNVTRRTNLPEVHVLEVKCEEDDHRALWDTLSDCPVRISRFSKYSAGTELRD